MIIKSAFAEDAQAHSVNEQEKVVQAKSAFAEDAQAHSVNEQEKVVQAITSLLPAQQSITTKKKLVSFCISMIVEVSLLAGVRNIVANHHQGRMPQTRAFLLSVAHCVRSFPCVPHDFTVASRAHVAAMVVQALSILPFSTPPGFSVL